MHVDGGLEGAGSGGAKTQRRVLVNALSAVLGGGVTVATRLVREIAVNHPHLQIVLVCSFDEVAEHGYPGNVEVVYRPDLIPRLPRWRWEQRAQPGFAKTHAIDVILQLGGYLCFGTAIPQVAVWQNPNVFTPPGIPRPLSEELLVRAQRIVQGWSMRRSADNIFLTAKSIEMASRYWDMNTVPNRVVHSGVELVSGDPRASAPLSNRENFALAVGSTYVHKNYEAMIDAMAHYTEHREDGLRLEIMGGGPNPDYFASLQKRIDDHGIADRVQLLGARPLEEVHQRMQQARAYLVTSRLETFGLTLFEAMSNGLPVVASNATCHPEVGGNAAVYCDPQNPADIAEKLAQIVDDKALAETYRERGFARLENFTWSNSATGYVAALEAAQAVSSR